MGGRAGIAFVAALEYEWLNMAEPAGWKALYCDPERWVSLHQFTAKGPGHSHKLGKQTCGQQGTMAGNATFPKLTMLQLQ